MGQRVEQAGSIPRRRLLRFGSGSGVLVLSLIVLLNVFLLDILLVDSPTLYHSSNALHVVYRPLVLNPFVREWSHWLIIVILCLHAAILYGQTMRLKLGVLLAFALLHALTDITLPVRLYSGEFAEDWWEEALPHNFSFEVLFGLMTLSCTLVAEWLVRQLRPGSKPDVRGIP